MWQKALNILTLFIVINCAVQAPAFATTDDLDSALCDGAAMEAASRFGVPVSVLMSIARVETGQIRQGELRPWPWTINSAGQGYFFETRQQAIDFAAAQIEASNINFDVGCFQVNLRWHSKGFTSLENAFDPNANAAYAAHFLVDLLHETGDWSGAVAAYHSRTEVHAEKYLTKVKSVWNDLKDTPPQDVIQPSPQRIRINNFPLFLSGRGTNGSLVPGKSADTPRFNLR